MAWGSVADVRVQVDGQQREAGGGQGEGHGEWAPAGLVPGAAPTDCRAVPWLSIAVVRDAWAVLLGGRAVDSVRRRGCAC